jgi:RES domain-containing protein
MRFWRIALARWALDKKCEGARVEGGRWNPVGTPALYAGTTPVICALEKFIHLDGMAHPPLKLVAVDIPDDEDLVYVPDMADLPPNWAELPVPLSSQEFGGKWLNEAEHLVMLVPSAVMPEAQNAVINPLHPAYKEVDLTILRDFTFDARMFNKA